MVESLNSIAKDGSGMGEGRLAAELGELVRMERRIQILDEDSVAGLATSYLEDDRGVTLVDLADLVVAGWNRLNVGSLISLARAI
jgi:hypothetical protein